MNPTIYKLLKNVLFQWAVRTIVSGLIISGVVLFVIKQAMSGLQTAVTNNNGMIVQLMAEDNERSDTLGDLKSDLSIVSSNVSSLSGSLESLIERQSSDTENLEDALSSLTPMHSEMEKITGDLASLSASSKDHVSRLIKIEIALKAKDGASYEELIGLTGSTLSYGSVTFMASRPFASSVLDSLSSTNEWDLVNSSPNFVEINRANPWIDEIAQFGAQGIEVEAINLNDAPYWIEAASRPEWHTFSQSDEWMNLAKASGWSKFASLPELYAISGSAQWDDVARSSEFESLLASEAWQTLTKTDEWNKLESVSIQWTSSPIDSVSAQWSKIAISPQWEAVKRTSAWSKVLESDHWKDVETSYPRWASGATTHSIASMAAIAGVAAAAFEEADQM